ncbi:MAG TPA: hypothetical protein VIA62_07930 [Thermoanaerobaculia bacterium]|jgi:hypothetical protein|nr:hypothetical protein [Thermoanaerobaculia bacterium]
MRNQGILLAVFAAMLLVSLSALAADPVIKHGVDTFTTTANGKTFYSFAQNPIPAGFFCADSAAFSGRVAFRGLPLVAGTPGALHNADTVIERLDDAVFNNHGVAETRIQFKALSLVSIAPIQTACGAYHAYVTLAGPQRVTTMKIYRTEADGGRFVAPIAVDAKISFIPVRPVKGLRPLEMVGKFTFPATPLPWSATAGAATKSIGNVLIDTKGNLKADTLVSGSSNFWPGWKPGARVQPKSCMECDPPICHDDGGEEHCTGGTYACYPYNCP